jgi:hypothetical protein
MARRKTNTKRFHLVNWDTVKAPIANGGLGIRDPTLMNLPSGTKILWRFITGESYRWKKVVLHKCLIGNIIRILDNPLPLHKGSQIWKLLKETQPIIQEKLTWIPRNGKKIGLSNDCILGAPPMSNDPFVTPILEWLKAQGKRTLHDISSGHPRTKKWLNWNIENIPEHLHQQSQTLLYNLRGCALMNTYSGDQREVGKTWLHSKSWI